MSEIAELYADGTALAWEAKMRQETRDEEKAERAREDAAVDPHGFCGSEFLPGFVAGVGTARNITSDYTKGEVRHR